MSRPPLDMVLVAGWLGAELQSVGVNPQLLAWRIDGAARFAVGANGKEDTVTLSSLEASLYAEWTHSKLDGQELDPRRLVAHLQRMAREVLSRLQPEGWRMDPDTGKAERRFNYTGEDFSGYQAANIWLLQAGYIIGMSDGDHPIGIVKGHTAVPKWSNATEAQRDAFDGRITWGGLGPRNGPALVTLKAAPQ